MGRRVFKLPDIGEGIAESEIAQWHVAVGDTVTEDQVLVDMLTDKAAVEIPASVNGTVLELGGAVGDMIAVGAPLIIIEVAGEGDDNTQSRSPVPTAVQSKSRSTAAPPVTPTAPPPTAKAAAKAVAVEAPKRATAALGATLRPGAGGLPRPVGEKPLASPAVRQRARELGIHLAYIPGSGPAHRVTQADVDAYIAAGSRPAASARVRREGADEIKIVGLRRKIAEAMQRSKQRIPHFAYVEEVDVTELEALRLRLNEQRHPEQAKLTLLPFLLQALVEVAAEFPQVNATFDDDAGILTQHHALHIGIATQTPKGLVVPVIRHAEMLDLWSAAAEIKRLAEAARAGKATREELSGSSITITSLGVMGGIASTPIINAPEVAIIGVNNIVERPVVRAGAITVRKMMNLSSSFDHRIVDGWNAAAFIQRIKRLLEQPGALAGG
ncbi:MAG: dihydrolipoamide acetyltransferase family protein [Nevskiales bacterium]